MTIECYYGNCPYHSSHFSMEGPFCDEYECQATPSDLKIYAEERFQYLLGRANPPKSKPSPGVAYG